MEIYGLELSNINAATLTASSPYAWSLYLSMAMISSHDDLNVRVLEAF